MANTRISDLTASASNLASTDLAPVVQTVGVGPVKMTGLQLAGGLLGSTTFNGSTVTTSQPVLNLSQTWNAVGVTFTGLKFNATDSNSASGSLLLDLQVGGTSRFKVDKAGNFYIPETSKFYFGGGGGTGAYFFANGGNDFRWIQNGVNTAALIGSFRVNSSYGYTWSGTANAYDTADLLLVRDAANTLALKNSTNPQIFRAYSTTASSGSYGYFASGVTDAGVATADTLFIGTGGAGAAMTKLALVVNGTTRLDYNILNTGYWTFQSQLYFTDGTNKGVIGPFTVSGEQPAGIGIAATAGSLSLVSNANGTAGRTVTVAYYNNTTWYSALEVANVASGYGTLSLMKTGGNVTIGSNAATVGNLVFGTTTSSFPALKRSSATLQVRLADDSAFGSFQTGGFSGGAPTIKTANYTQLEADYSLIFNGTGSITLTLLAAATYPGKILYVKTIAAQTVVSASSNVKPIDTDTAGTAILAATAGKWAMLQSDGTNWVIMAQG